MAYCAWVKPQEQRRKTGHESVMQDETQAPSIGWPKSNG